MVTSKPAISGHRKTGQLAGARWTQEQSIFMFGNEASDSQIEDHRAIGLFVEGEIEVVQGFLRVAKLGLFLSAIEQAVTLLMARELKGFATLSMSRTLLPLARF